MDVIIRPSGRASDELRSISFERDYMKNATSSVLVNYGDTRVVCTATIEERVPQFLKGKGRGWLTAEYGMLPCSTQSRMSRESVRGKQTGRTQEIQRLIGRSLRACLDFTTIGEYTITIDCDVIQADGGTRTASISGGYIALRDAIDSLPQGVLARNPIHGMIASVSAGIYKGVVLLDLDYKEDSNAETDLNVVMNDAGHYIEVQGTAEGHAFRQGELEAMLKLARQGVKEIIALQKSCLEL